jgi:diguanylate cyclase (GGDEF)-like protein
MLEPFRILIADHNVENRTRYKRLLILEGNNDYIFFEADTARKALASIHNNPPDCILLDCQLPDLDDLDLRNELSDGCHEKTPAVVMLSAANNDLPSVRSVTDGVHDLIVKAETSGGDLRRAIDAAIEKAGLRHLLKLREGALKRMAVTDELTGLYSRLYAINQLEEEIYRAQRYDTPVCIAMIDIDQFKRINDQEGHAAGDRILKDISELFNKTTRSLDIVARYGHEKFLIILPNTGLEQAKVLSERLRQKIKALKLAGSAEDWLPVSFSIGLAEYEIGVQTKDSLIQRANQALCEAKSRGRDCLWIWSANSALAATNEL